MNQFFKFLFASCFGVILASLVLFGIGTLIVTRIIASAEKPSPVSPNSVLHLTFNKTLPEQTNNTPIDFNEFSQDEILGLQDVLEAIEAAAEDDNIRGVFLDLGSIPFGQATAAVLHEQLVEFKDSDKFIIAYGDNYTQSGYYLASVADKIVVHPLGGVDFKGLAAFVPFFKNMFDKLGIEWQVFYEGDFKGASEPYRLTKLSEENRLQISQFINQTYDQILADISEARTIPIEELKEISSELKINNPEDAKMFRLVDEVGYKDLVYADLRQRLGIDEDEKIKMASIDQYHKAYDKDKKRSKNKIAVVYAEGAIVTGKGDVGQIGDQKYTKIIRNIRKKDDVKAIVLRVNSPGGSALASESIWRELSLAKEDGKKIIVSMGDLAASGGYYISCIGDSILAEDVTLTGSIGVVGMIPNAQELMNDKLGITFDTVKTGKHSEGLNTVYPISDKHAKAIKSEMGRIYDIFLNRVAEGRGMSYDDVKKIAGGRVWTGMKAIEIGLVDKIGGLDEAIDIAANSAGLEDYRTIEYPRIKDPFNQLLEEIMGENNGMVKQQLIKEELGEYYPYYKHMKEMSEMEGVQARLPYFIEFR